MPKTTCKIYEVTVHHRERISAESEQEAFEIFWDTIHREYQDFEQECTEIEEELISLDETV
jgi:hypothetical protein